MIASMEKGKFYSVDYIPSRGKNKAEQTTLYYFNCELLSWLKDTTTLESGMLTKSQKMTTLWKHGEIPKADIANEGGVYFPRSKKPEQLLRRIIERSTDPGDIVLDSFLGSGTTAAVAHKMGRRYIGIEMGDHAYTHCKARLDAVIDGVDPLGITKSINWQGGGGYRFYELAPTLINEDAFGEAVINPNYDADTLAAAVALHEGFTYQPSADFFWKQAIGNESSYLFTTTRHLTAAYLDTIKGSMEEGEYLVINRRYILSKNNRKGNRTMTEQRMKEACKEYARCQQNILSSSAERRMAELDAEAAKAGLRFHMTNEAGYMNPHFIGEPKYELVAISKSKMNTSELRELAVNLGADRKKLYGTSRQSILLIISQLEKEARAAV